MIENTLKYGVYFSPENKRYINDVVVNCSHCQESNLIRYIGFHNYNLCLHCLYKFDLNMREQNKEQNKEQECRQTVNKPIFVSNMENNDDTLRRPNLRKRVNTKSRFKNT